MYRLYRIATRLSAKTILNKRLAKGKEDAKRIGERMGQSKLKRPEGALLWVHGASVGEVTSLLTLVQRLQAQNKDLSVLITSGTKTSADIIKNRAHQILFISIFLWTTHHG